MPFTPCDPNASSCTDVSVGILQKIFGDAVMQLAVGGDPSALTPDTSVIATLMMVFNGGIFTVAALIMCYIMVAGIVHTANDGEVLGKNWSSVWTPLRVVSGMGALLPSATGYSYLQMLVLSIALWSIGFANLLFKEGVTNGIIGGNLNTISSELGMGSSATANTKYPLYDLRKFGSDALAIMWCEYTVTTTYDLNVSTGTEKPIISIKLDAQPDSMQMESMYKRSNLYLFKDRNDASNLAGGAAICGSIKEYQYFTPTAITVLPEAGSAFNSSTISDNATAMMAIRQASLNAKKIAAAKLAVDLGLWVKEWPSDLDVPDGQTPTWDTVHADRFNMILNDAQNNMEAALYLQIQNDSVLKTILAKYVDDITKDGWAMAGGFYQRLGGLREEMGSIYSEPVFEATKPDLSQLPDDLLGEHVKNNYSVVYDQVISKATTGTSYTSNSFTSDISGFRSQFGTNPEGLSVDSLGNRGSGYMSSAVGKIMQGSIDTLVGTDGHVDMLARIKTLGDSLKLADTVVSALIYDVHFTLDTMKIIAAGADSVKLAGFGLNSAPIVEGIRGLFDDAFAKNLAQLASWLGRLAFWFGIFIPTLPYLIFLMAVVGWILSVVQAMVAAPLWAIMHMTPERSFIGGQQQGYLLLLSLFARPPLILIGLFVAIAAINPIIQYVSIFFFAVRNANVTSSESLGWFMQFLTFKDWLIMYALVITPIIYMVFGLSQTLPDTVLSWIGAGIKSMGETNATNEMRAAMIKHDASGSPISNRGNRLGQKPTNGLPQNGGNGGANPSYGTGTSSRGGVPLNGGGGGNAHKDKPVNANPQGVAPTQSTANSTVNNQSAGFSASSPKATSSNANKVLSVGGEVPTNVASSTYSHSDNATVQSGKDKVIEVERGVVPREIEKI